MAGACALVRIGRRTTAGARERLGDRGTHGEGFVEADQDQKAPHPRPGDHPQRGGVLGGQRGGSGQYSQSGGTEEVHL